MDMAWGKRGGTDGARRRRKDLTAAERSRLMGEQIENAREIAIAEVKANEKPAHIVRGKRGPKKSAGSGREVEARTGISEATARKAKTHVTALDAYPFMENWNQSNSIEAFKHIESLPEKDKPRAAAMVSGPAIPPDNALTMLGTLAVIATQSAQFAEDCCNAILGAVEIAGE